MFLTSDRSLRSSLIMALLVLFCIVVAGLAESSELRVAREPLAFANTFSDTFTYEVPATESASSLPDAYLFYSEDGAAFYVTRWSEGSAESVDILVPADASLMIPAPKASRIDGLWRHVFYLNATTVTDSVFVIPFDR